VGGAGGVIREVVAFHGVAEQVEELDPGLGLAGVGGGFEPELFAWRTVAVGENRAGVGVDQTDEFVACRADGAHGLVAGMEVDLAEDGLMQGFGFAIKNRTERDAPQPVGFVKTGQLGPRAGLPGKSRIMAMWVPKSVRRHFISGKAGPWSVVKSTSVSLS